MPEFVKYDVGKCRLDLIPAEAVWALGDVLTAGIKKGYPENNWLLGANWSRYWGALLRHLFAWLRGETKDPETGYSHLAHAFCCLMFLLVYEARKLGTDDLRGTETKEVFR